MIKTFDYQNGKIKITYNESPVVKDYKYDWKKHQIEVMTFPVSLLFNDSRVYKGLPEEYVESVIRKVTSEI